MSAKTTSAYIATVRSDRTIVLPDEIAVGTTVAVVPLPPPKEQEEAGRKERFSTTIDAIRDASEIEDTPSISDEDLNALIKQAISSAKA